MLHRGEDGEWEEVGRHPSTRQVSRHYLCIQKSITHRTEQSIGSKYGSIEWGINSIFIHSLSTTTVDGGLNSVFFINAQRPAYICTCALNYDFNVLYHP